MKHSDPGGAQRPWRSTETLEEHGDPGSLPEPGRWRFIEEDSAQVFSPGQELGKHAVVCPITPAAGIEPDTSQRECQPSLYDF